MNRSRNYTYAYNEVKWAIFRTLPAHVWLNLYFEFQADGCKHGSRIDSDSENIFSLTDWLIECAFIGSRQLT